jgi:hypothetical protein
MIIPLSIFAGLITSGEFLGRTGSPAGFSDQTIQLSDFRHFGLTKTSADAVPDRSRVSWVCTTVLVSVFTHFVVPIFATVSLSSIRHNRATRE